MFMLVSYYKLYMYCSFDFPIILCLLVAGAFWLFRVVKVVYNIFLYYEIRAFYNTALRISPVSIIH